MMKYLQYSATQASNCPIFNFRFDKVNIASSRPIKAVNKLSLAITCDLKWGEIKQTV